MGSSRVGQCFENGALQESRMGTRKIWGGGRSSVWSVGAGWLGSRGARVPKALQTWPVSCCVPYRQARRRVASNLWRVHRGTEQLPILPGPARVSPATRCRPRRLPMAASRASAFTVRRVCSMSPRGPEREAGGVQGAGPRERKGGASRARQTIGVCGQGLSRDVRGVWNVRKALN